MRNSFVALSLFLLSGCAIPGVSSGVGAYLSYSKSAGDAISFVASDKTLNDHVISAALQKDCVLFRALKDEDICAEIEKETEVAEVKPMIEPIAPEPVALVLNPMPVQIIKAEPVQIVRAEPVIEKKSFLSTIIPPRKPIFEPQVIIPDIPSVISETVEVVEQPSITNWSFGGGA